jgi:aspartate kinase
MVVLKFGGSSVADAPSLLRVRAIVAAERRPRIVVVSALGGVTDGLIDAAARAAAGDEASALAALRALRARHASLAGAVRNPAARGDLLARLDEGWREVAALLRPAASASAVSPAVSDAVVAHGELASSRLTAAVLADGGLPAEWIDARDVIVTDDRHNHASPLELDTADRLSRRVRPLIALGAIPVLGGFIGATADGVTTTLGRGGSDYSASLVGGCLGASEIQIWTDVDGILTADPRVFTRARPIDRLSFGEASALARFGAKVLHPATVRPAVTAGIPVRVLNSRRPAGRGTLITGAPGRRPGPVAGIASLRNLCAIEVALPEGSRRPAALAAVFEACARADAAVRLASVSDASVSVVIDDGPVGERAAALLESRARVVRRRGLALVAAVGDDLAGGRGIAWRVLAACDTIHVHLVSRAPGSNHLALVVDETDLAAAVAALHTVLVERAVEPGAYDERRDRPSIPLPAHGHAGQELPA